MTRYSSEALTPPRPIRVVLAALSAVPGLAAATAFDFIARYASCNAHLASGAGAGHPFAGLTVPARALPGPRRR